MLAAQRFFDINFTIGSIDEVRAMLVGAARSSETSILVTPNVDHVVALSGRLSEDARSAYLSADFFLCDSKILGALARLSGVDLTPRSGADRVTDILDTETLNDLVVAIVGPTLEQTDKLRQRYPGWRFIHIDAPALLEPGSAAWDACIEKASGLEWQVLLSCLSMPKQELFADAVRAKRQKGGLIMCVGATVDFLSGASQRAPMAFQRLGLEWLHRLLTNPRRLWRRYLVEGPKIFLLYARRLREGRVTH